MRDRKARISFNNKLPPANFLLVPLTLCLILVSSTLSQRANVWERHRREHTRCQKSPDLQLQPKCNSGKVRKWEISPTCDSRPQLIYKYPRHPIPFHASKSNSITHCCKSARTSGPLNVFGPWSKLFYKYTHVRRAWPSLGQVHSEFGSELEQPLASRLHWTKGAEHVR